MKQTEVQIGGLYKAKVTNRVVTVQILRENTHGGWDALNTATNKEVRIKSAARLHGPARGTNTVVKTPTSKRVGKQTAQPSSTTTPPASPDETTIPAKPQNPTPANKPLTLVDAAISVLQASDEPLSCPAIVAKAIAAGIWQPKSGKTPASTLYSSILREITQKGQASRFVKAERGKFKLS